MSPLYVGWVQGYAPEGRKALEERLPELEKLFPQGMTMAHPKTVLETLATELKPEWLHRS